jgi:hypothetical protein
LRGDLPVQEPSRRYLEDLLTRKCERRGGISGRRTVMTNHRRAVKPEIVGKRRRVRKDSLVQLQKIYEFKADGMNILPCTPIVQMSPSGDLHPIVRSLSCIVEVVVSPSVSSLPISIAQAKSPKVIGLCRKATSIVRSPPCDILENFQGDGVLILRAPHAGF